MANYENLKSAIQEVVKTNGNNEITGALLQQTLFSMVNALGVGYQFIDIATPTTNPGTPDQNVFYIASTAGTYSNFGGIILESGEVAILTYNGSWSKKISGFASLQSISHVEQIVNGSKFKYDSIPAGWRYQELDIVLTENIEYEIQLSISSSVSGTIYAALVSTPTQDATAICTLNIGAGKTESSLQNITFETIPEKLYLRTYYGSTITNLTLSCIGSNTNKKLNERTTVVEDAVFSKYDGIQIGTRIGSRYVRYSDGVLVSTGSYFDVYEIQNNNYSYIDIFCGYPDSIPAAIAFYNKEQYLQSASVQGNNVDRYYRAIIPEECTIIRVTNRNGTIANPKIEIVKNRVRSNEIGLDELTPTILPIRLYMDETVLSGWRYKEIKNKFKSGIKYYFEISTPDALDAALYAYITPQSGSQDSNAIVALSIYAGTNIGRAFVVFNQDYDVLYLTTYCAASKNNVSANVYVDTTSERISKELTLSDIRRWCNPFVNNHYYHHLNVEGDTTIPSQSLLDIEYSKRLGFTIIEANVHRCSDGIYVVKHGNNGALGSGLIFDESSGISSTTLFSDVTSVQIRQYVKYNSPIIRNQVYIPTLDEFCERCNSVGMGVVLQTPNDDVLNIARKYLTDDKIIAYGLSKRGDFRGIIMFYGNANDANGIVQRAYSVGGPFLFVWQNYNSVNDSVRKSVIYEMHKNGYLVGCGYLQPNAVLYGLKLGLDVICSTYKEINSFSDGNIINNLNDDRYTFTNVVFQNGVLDCQPGGLVKFVDASNIYGVTKISIAIRYVGKLSIMIGSGAKNANYGLYEIESDGKDYINYSATCERSEDLMYIVADMATTITELRVVYNKII